MRHNGPDYKYLITQISDAHDLDIKYNSIM